MRLNEKVFCDAHGHADILPLFDLRQRQHLGLDMWHCLGQQTKQKTFPVELQRQRFSVEGTLLMKRLLGFY